MGIPILVRRHLYIETDPGPPGENPWPLVAERQDVLRFAFMMRHPSSSMIPWNFNTARYEERIVQSFWMLYTSLLCSVLSLLLSFKSIMRVSVYFQSRCFEILQWYVSVLVNVNKIPMSLTHWPLGDVAVILKVLITCRLVHQAITWAICCP